LRFVNPSGRPRYVVAFNPYSMESQLEIQCNLQFSNAYTVLNPTPIFLKHLKYKILIFAIVATTPLPGDPNLHQENWKCKKTNYSCHDQIKHLLPGSTLRNKTK